MKKSAPRGQTDAITAGHVTADDVARTAGVSRWTVNRAFKKDASISPASREKVMEAARQLGYLPDLRAAALASDRSNLVALLIDDFKNPHKLVMLEQLTRALRRKGWDTLLVNTLDAEDTGRAMITAGQRRVDAAILIGIQFDDAVIASAASAARLRKLIIFARTSHHPDTISIAVDDVAATREIAAYIRQKGYRRPFYLAGPRTFSAHLLRKETFDAEWLASTGKTPDTSSVPVYDPKLAEDEVFACLAHRTPDTRPDIIVCENDALALGAMDCIRHRLHLRVPEDIAVIGFDDIPQAAGAHYRLTTYRQPIGAMAEHLAEILEAGTPADASRLFEGTLMIRDTA